MAWKDGLRWSQIAAAAWLAVALVLAPAARAQDTPNDRERAQQDEIDELKRQLSVVVDEVTRLRSELTVPEQPEHESAYGLGPAASKVYGVGRGLSIGGYAEALYVNQVNNAPGNGNAATDMLRTVLYVGYKFNDSLLFNTEIEFEHAGTSGGGSASVELATLDYLYRPELNFRAGLVLLPMGFLNEVHEPPFYLGTARPSPERQIIPTTWRENGVGLFGSWGEDRVQYRAYVVNGMDATGFSSSGLRGGRQKGSRASANDLAFVGRLDVEPLDGLTVGGSYYRGNSGQDQDITLSGGGPTVKLPGTLTTIWEAHAEYRHGALFTRALWTGSSVDNAGQLSRLLEVAPNRSIAERMQGGYVEAAYDVMQLLLPGSEKELSPFFRFEYLDTQSEIATGFVRDRRQPRRVYIPGIEFKPHPSVVLKLDYRKVDNWTGDAPDELAFGFGLIF
jgi:hypothetical protein